MNIFSLRNIHIHGSTRLGFSNINSHITRNCSNFIAAHPASTSFLRSYGSEARVCVACVHQLPPSVAKLRYCQLRKASVHGYRSFATEGGSWWVETKLAKQAEGGCNCEAARGIRTLLSPSHPPPTDPSLSCTRQAEVLE